MIWFLVRVTVLVLIVVVAYAFVSGGYAAVTRHYSWMHPDPHTVHSRRATP